MKGTMRVSILGIAYLLLLLGQVTDLQAQQRIGYIDSEFILQYIPEYATVQQKLDRMVAEWQRELDALQQELEEMEREFQAREILYTQEERQRKLEELRKKETEIYQRRRRYFGPNGELFKEQEKLMQPIQERVLKAVEEVATRDGYDFVFDKSGDFLFVFAREQYDLSLAVLEELGIDTEKISRQ